MGIQRTLGWFRKVGWKRFFTFDISDHKTFIGGYMGTAHTLVTSVALFIIWFFVRNLSAKVAIWYLVATILISNFWWYRRESKKFTTTPWRTRSTKEVTLDTRLDFVLQFIVGLIIFFVWVYRHRAGLV